MAWQTIDPLNVDTPNRGQKVSIERRGGNDDQFLEGCLFLWRFGCAEVTGREHHSITQEEFMHLLFAGRVTLFQAHVSLALMDAHLIGDCEL